MLRVVEDEVGEDQGVKGLMGGRERSQHGSDVLAPAVTLSNERNKQRKKGSRSCSEVVRVLIRTPRGSGHRHLAAQRP